MAMRTLRWEDGSERFDAYVDMSTIRKRVARIKSGWDDETRRQRAAEGRRRRAELARMLLGDSRCCSAAAVCQDKITLVG